MSAPAAACIFCQPEREIIAANARALAVFDKFPVSPGHALEIVLRGTTIAGLRFHGVEIEDFHQPRRMATGEQAALMDRFWAATDRLAARESGAPQS